MFWHVLSYLVLLSASASAVDEPAQWLAAAIAVRDSGQTEVAQERFNDIVSFYAQTPEAVIAHHALALIFHASGNHEQAAQHNVKAWELYKKKSRQPGFAEHDVLHAAAGARWTLLKQEYATVEQRLQGRDFRAGSARRIVDEFEAACTELMTVDSDCGAHALSLIGTVRAVFAEALLQDTEQSVDPSRKGPPYITAVPEFRRAAAAFSQSYELALGYPDKEQLAQASAQAAFELTVRQGDLVLLYAVEKSEHAPRNQSVADTRIEQLDYLLKEVAPLLSEGVEHHSRAVQMASYMPVKEPAAELQQRLDVPFRDRAEELVKFGHDYCHSFYSSAVEAGSMSAMSFDAKVVVTAVDAMDVRFIAMEAAVKKISPVLMSWIGYAPQASRALWDGWIIALFANHANALRSAQENLERCQAKVDKKSSVESAAFYRRLTKLHAEVVSTEYHTLMAWHEFVSKANIGHPQNEQLYKRLAEVDPVHFGALPNSSAADRPKP